MGGQCFRDKISTASSPKVAPLDQDQENELVPAYRDLEKKADSTGTRIIVARPKHYQRNQSVHALRAALVKKPGELQRTTSVKIMYESEGDPVSGPEEPPVVSKLISHSLTTINLD